VLLPQLTPANQALKPAVDAFGPKRGPNMVPQTIDVLIGNIGC